jgi:hypothetical protein
VFILAGVVGDRPERSYRLARSETGQSVHTAGAVGDRPERSYSLARSETGQSVHTRWRGRRPARACALPGMVGNRPERWRLGGVRDGCKKGRLHLCCTCTAAGVDGVMGDWRGGWTWGLINTAAARGSRYGARGSIRSSLRRSANKGRRHGRCAASESPATRRRCF